MVADAPDRLELDLGPDGRVEEIGRWRLADGAELRVVRWELRGPARQLVAWARGQSDADVTDEWHAGAAIERRDTPLGRWQPQRRQDLTATDLTPLAGRLGGWVKGLAAHAERLAARA